MEKKSGSVNLAFRILQVVFTVGPIGFGIDKFLNTLTNWNIYVAPVITRTLPFSTTIFLRTVGVFEIIAGIIVALRPRIGSLIVSLWLCVVMVNLLFRGGFYDIILGDVGLALGAFSLSLLSKECMCEPS